MLTRKDFELVVLCLSSQQSGLHRAGPVDQESYNRIVATLQPREPAVLKHGKLICSCGNKSMPPNLEEGGYSVTHELKKITPSTIEATGWAGSSSECCESGEDYFLSCRQCGKEYDLLPGQTIEWQ